ncbi:MAG: peptide ABC transporter substrate-binding protein, partial [Wenzhouxiangellaceae bacterium]|nr:peptide ABC transporter substrate-binding protein [Wenzhouxiangellaceae bacterium]
MIRTLALIALGLALCSVRPAAGAEQVIHRGLGPAPGTLDIHRAQGISAFNLLRDLHEGLLTRDAGGRPVAAIARRWHVSGDGREWTFDFDPDARWSDGQPITADDFVRGFESARDPATASPTARWLAPVVDIAAIAPDRLRIRLERRVPWFDELLTLPVAFPWPDGGRAVYSGAFVLERETPGARFELARNRHFRAAGDVGPDRVVWHVTEDPSAELARFRTGELHVTETVPPGRLDWLDAELGGALRVAPYLGSFYLAFNLSRPPFAGRPKVREALSLAIDRDILVDRVLGTGERPAWRLVPPGMPGWPPAGHEAQPGIAHMERAERIERARELYRAAGFGRDRPLELELRFNSSLSHRRLAVAVAAMWKQYLGVRTRLVNEEWKVFVTNRRHGR